MRIRHNLGIVCGLRLPRILLPLAPGFPESWLPQSRHVCPVPALCGITVPFPWVFPSVPSCPAWNLTCWPALLGIFLWRLHSAPGGTDNPYPLPCPDSEHPDSLLIPFLTVDPWDSSCPFHVTVHFRQWRLHTSSSPLGASTTFSVFSNLLVTRLWFGMDSTGPWLTTPRLGRLFLKQRDICSRILMKCLLWIWPLNPYTEWT